MYIPKMRIRLKTLFIALCLVPVVVLVGCGVARILGFVNIFFVHSGIILTQADAHLAHNSSSPDSRPQLIPKITHQIFHNWRDPGNDTLPPDWVEARQTCLDKNPDFKHMLWTEKKSRDFIATEYAWFLNTYDGYRFPVQRVDAMRYFLMVHYGGIYIDLDNGCMSSLEPLLYYPVWITDGSRGALSNNILASRPNHPFWTLLTQSLRDYDYNYVFPYITISYASGQWFETDVWQKYHAMLPDPDKVTQENRLYRLVMDDRESDTWLFFTQERGGTWRNWDNKLFLLIGDHLILFLIGVCTLIGLSTWVTVRVVRRVLRRRRVGGYQRLDEHVPKLEEDCA